MATRHPARHGRPGRPGFTLVELLVVVVVILILAAIVAPVYNGFTQGSRLTTAQNLIDSVMAQARSTAVRLQRDVLVVGYWRGQEYDATSGRPVVSKRMDRSSSLIVLVEDLNGSNRSPRVTIPGLGQVPVTGGFLPAQELGRPGSKTSGDAYGDPAFTVEVSADNYQAAANAVTPVTRLPPGVALVRPRTDVDPANTTELQYDDFLLIRFRPDGTLSGLPPIYDPNNPTSMNPSGNIRDWLKLPWRMNQATTGTDQINGDDAAERQRRGIYLVLPDRQIWQLKQPTNVIVLYDAQKMADAGIDPSQATNAQAANDWIRQNGLVGVINSYTGKVTFTGGAQQ